MGSVESRSATPSEAQEPQEHFFDAMSETMRMSDINGRPYAAWAVLEIDDLPVVAPAYRVGAEFQNGKSIGIWNVYYPVRPDKYVPAPFTDPLNGHEMRAILRKFGVKKPGNLTMGQLYELMRTKLEENAASYDELFAQYNADSEMRSHYGNIMVEWCREHETTLPRSK